MSLAPQGGPSSAVSREGSRTALVVQNAEQRDASSAALPGLAVGLPPAGTLRLRGAPRDGPHVAWDEHVVDNEGLGRKKSKSTCLQELMLEDICVSNAEGLSHVYQFVASTIDQDNSTSRRTKIHLNPSRARMMTGQRSRLDGTVVIGTMWMGKARATGVESRKISDGEGATTGMHMNG